MNSIQEPLFHVFVLILVTSDDFVCAVTVSKFSMSASVTKWCLAALADMLKAERMSVLSL